MNELALGVDIGGVIIGKVDDNTDTSFLSNIYLQTKAISGAFDALRQLVEKRFGKRVFLVSKCRRLGHDRTFRWLEYHCFYEATGIDPANVRVCRERSDKARICEELGITHFVDDRLEVLGHLTQVKNLYLFQPSPEEVEQFSHFLTRVCWVNSWEEILQRELA
jgi:hypothetical protein